MNQRYYKGPNRLATMHVDMDTLEVAIVAISVQHDKDYRKLNVLTGTDMYGGRLQLGGDTIEQVALKIAEDLYDIRDQLEGDRFLRDEKMREDIQRAEDEAAAMREVTDRG